MIDQNFFPNNYTYKFYASPPTIASILFFDVVVDNAQIIIKGYNYSNDINTM